jgi:hypothetical protein
MDNDFCLGLERISETLRSAEVVIIRFPIVADRLLIDNRFSDADPPLVKLVPRAHSAQERFRSLKQLRPRFRHPEKIRAISWPKYARTMIDCGLAETIRERIAQAGFPQVACQCDEVFRELVEMERRETRKAILGIGYQCIWARDGR